MPHPFALPAPGGFTGGGPYQAGMGSIPQPGGSTPQQRGLPFAGPPGPAGGGAGPMGAMDPGAGGIANPMFLLPMMQAIVQGALGVGMGPEDEVKEYAQNTLNLGKNVMGTMEEMRGMRNSLLSGVFGQARAAA